MNEDVRTDTPDYAPLAGKTALVTGGARRVGAEIVRALQGAGANVLIHYHHSAAEANSLVRELEARRAGSAMSYTLDLLDTAQIDQLPRQATRKFGGLDILINNASTFYPTAVGEITEAHWNDLIGSNLKAPLFLSQAAAPALRLAHGLIVNILDIHGMRPLRRYLTYSVAKAGLAMLTRGLARELGPQVRVNGVAPGPVMWPEDSDADQAFQQRIIDRTVLKRAGSSEDVARAVLFFATQAPYVTGQILAIDGGRSIGW
jgi:pteridine reductase